MPPETAYSQKDCTPKAELLLLPRELRDHIYSFLVLSDLQAFVDKTIKPALLQTSIQVRNEYSEIFFDSELLKFDAYFGEGSTWQAIHSKQAKRNILENCVFTDMLDFWSVASARRYCQRLYSDWQGNVRTGIMTISTRSGIRRWQWSIACGD